VHNACNIQIEKGDVDSCAHKVGIR
jgi:hypothetical protein